MENMEINLSDLINNSNGGGNKFAPSFSDSVYIGHVIGAVRKNVEYEGVTKPKDCLIVSVYDDNDVLQTLQTPPVTPSFDEKSTMYKLMSGLTKEVEKTKIAEKLIAMNLAKFEDDKFKFNFCNFIGKTFQFMVSVKPAKNGKMYNNILSILPTKPNQKFEVKPEVSIPWFMTEGAISYQLKDGVTVFQPKDKGVVSEVDGIDEFTRSLQEDLA